MQITARQAQLVIHTHAHIALQLMTYTKCTSFLIVAPTLGR